MQEMIVNNVPGTIITHRTELENFGLGGGMEFAGFEFVPDAQPKEAPSEYRFDLNGSPFYNGSRVKIYEVYKKVGEAWEYQDRLIVPYRTAEKRLREIYLS
jgi:hypothetical protein